MNVLYITRKFPPVVGGMEQMNYHLVRQLRLQTNITAFTWGHSQLGLPWFLAASAVRALALRPVPDVICLGDALLSPVGVGLKRMLKRPVVSVVHGLDVTFRLPVYQMCVPPCLRRLDRLVAVSRFTREACLDRGVDPVRVTVIPNGIETVSSIPLAQARERLQGMLAARGVEWSPRVPTLLTAGRLVRRKGVREFIEKVFPELLRESPELRYLVVGEGDQRPLIEEAIARLELGRNVVLLGRVENDLLRTAYEASDLFVMPNIVVPGNVEGFGIVALEASAHGLPVVASDLEGIRDVVVDNRNGFRVPWDQPAAFQSVIRRLLSDEAERNALRVRSVEYASSFTWDRIAAHYVKVFEEVSAQGLPDKTE